MVLSTGLAKRLPCLCLLFLFVVVCRTAKADSSPPPAYLEAKSLAREVIDSQQADPIAKANIQNAFAGIENSFSKLREDVQSAESAYKEKAEGVNEALMELNRRIEIHNNKPHVFDPKTESAASAQYNAEKQSLDTEVGTLSQRWDQEVTPLEKQLAKAQDTLKQWAAGPTLTAFNESCRDLMAGKKGKAYQQLLDANANRDFGGAPVYDGGRGIKGTEPNSQIPVPVGQADIEIRTAPQVPEKMKAEMGPQLEKWQQLETRREEAQQQLKQLEGQPNTYQNQLAQVKAKQEISKAANDQNFITFSINEQVRKAGDGVNNQPQKP